MARTPHQRSTNTPFSTITTNQSPDSVAHIASQLDARRLVQTLSHLGERPWRFPLDDNNKIPAESNPLRIIGRLSLPPCTLCLELCFASALAPAERVSLFTIFERNMRQTYEANPTSATVVGPGGWDPAGKQRELFHPKSRYLVVYDNHHVHLHAERCTRPSSPIAFAMFRFDVEPCHAKDPVNADRRSPAVRNAHFRTATDAPAPQHKTVEVLYLYELQVAPQARSVGLGTTLIELLVDLAIHTRMRKICLTTFSNNTAALRLYQRLGWTKDRISPPKSDAVPWEILSRPVGIYSQW